jgi:Sap, sulfolipid-1-addressing protein
LPRQWTSSDEEVAAVTNAWESREAGALLRWARWAVESLDYLVRLDDRAFGHSRRVLYGNEAGAIDLAHVRWASGMAVTAIDLCAAVLGRKYCGQTGDRELSLASFYPKRNAKERWDFLPAPAKKWLSGVNRYPDFQTIKRARDPLTHRRLLRTLYGGTRKPGPHEQRTGFPVLANGALLPSDELVRLASSVWRRDWTLPGSGSVGCGVEPPDEGTALVDLAIIPLAITMMAGPQIASAIIFVTVPRPVPVSLAFVAGVAIAETIGVTIAWSLAELLGKAIDLGSPSDRGSIGHVIQYVLVGLLVLFALRNWRRRATIEPPKWLGTLMTADPKRAFRVAERGPS